MAADGFMEENVPDTFNSLAPTSIARAEEKRINRGKTLRQTRKTSRLSLFFSPD